MIECQGPLDLTDYLKRFLARRYEGIIRRLLPIGCILYQPFLGKIVNDPFSGGAKQEKLATDKIVRTCSLLDRGAVRPSPGVPLLTATKVDGADVAELLALASPDCGSRYFTGRQISWRSNPISSFFALH